MATGIPDFRDPDADGDGIADNLEADNLPPLLGTDTDNERY